MHVLFLNLYSGAVERGAESFAHGLAGKLKDRGHQIRFIKGKGNQIPEDGFRGSLFRKLSKRLFLDRAGRSVLFFSLKQVGLIWREDFEVIIPLNGFWQVLILKLLQPFKGYRIVITGHSGPGWDERWNLYLKPDVFVASTGPMKQWAKKTCPWTRVELIPYGIETDWGRSRLTGKLVTSELERNINNLDRPILLCPSALVPYKRVDLAIRAVSKLKRGSLVVVGKGELEHELRKLGEKLLPGRFVITSVKYEQMPLLYQKADLVTLPSSPQENSPMVFVEALACGKKVVATDAPRVRWALENAGFYCDPEDTDAYAKTLKKALKSKVNTSTPLQKFLWENVVEEYERILSV